MLWTRAAGIGFPVIITALIPFRHYFVPRMLAPEELAVLDAPTANSDAVLVSLGGPLQPERRYGRFASNDEAATTGASAGQAHMTGEAAAAYSDEETGLRPRRRTADEDVQAHTVPGGGLQKTTAVKR